MGLSGVHLGVPKELHSLGTAQVLSGRGMVHPGKN